MKKTNLIRSFLCLLLTLLIVLSALSVGVFAEEPDTDTASAEDVSATVGETEETEEKKMIFEPMNFVTNIKYMGVGMLGIFIVIGVIILSVVVLNKVTAPKKEKTEE